MLLRFSEGSCFVTIVIVRHPYLECPIQVVPLRSTYRMVELHSFNLSYYVSGGDGLRRAVSGLCRGANSPPNLTFPHRPSRLPFLFPVQPSSPIPTVDIGRSVLLLNRFLLPCDLFPFSTLTFTELGIHFRRDHPSPAGPSYSRQPCPPWITTWISTLHGHLSHTTSPRQVTQAPYQPWMAGLRV